MMATRRDFTLLRSLRGIGAILIFYHHFGFDGSVVMSFGDFAVSLFFMLSGLVLVASVGSDPERLRKLSVFPFFKKRLIKIYPVYLLSLIAAIKLNGLNLRALPFDLCLLQSWVPLPSFYFSGNPVSWFVSSLFLAYLLFCPLIKFLKFHPRRFLWCFLILMMTYVGIVLTVPDRLETGIIYICPLMQLPAFILGMLVWKLFEHFPGRQISTTYVTALQIIVILIPVCQMFLYHYVDSRWSLASYWWIPDMLLLYAFLVSERCETVIFRIFRLKAMQLLGEISFVFYLFHMVVIWLWRRLMNYADFELPLGWSSIVCLLITILVAWILHKYVELPVAAYFKRSGSKSFT